MTWEIMDRAPRDGTYILMDIGETIPGAPDIRVGSFLTGKECEEIGHREQAKYGGWMFWNTDCDWFVLDVDEPRGWLRIPPKDTADAWRERAIR